MTSMQGREHETLEVREQAQRVVETVREALDPRTVAAKLDPVGFAPALAGAARSVLTRPVAAARTGLGWGVDAGRAGVVSALRAVGSTASGPAVLAERDPRYADPVWEENAWYWLCRQQHGLLADRLRELTAGMTVDPVSRRKIDFLVGQLVEAAAPPNWPISSPALVQRAFQTGGKSLVRGARNALRDLVQNGGMPRQFTPGELKVGEQLGATPGKVVFRNRLIELIQYAPQTPKVHAVPLLMSPPWINKYYIMDLAPGRSLVEWAVQHGHTVFMISYRNPDSSLRELSMSDYLREGPVAALDAVQRITGAPKVNVAGLCLGGAIATSMVAWLSARGEDRVNSLTLMNTMLDYTRPGMLGVFVDEPTVDRLERTMRKDGYLPAASMKRTFDLLRATDLVWNYVGTNWFQGDDPRPFDMLTWNGDSTRMPAEMQTEYLRTHYLRNELAEGKLELAGERLDLGDVTQDAYVITAERDHIAPWESVYTGARKLGGTVRFVLSNSGHIAGVVNPPSPKSRHWFSETAELPRSSADWRDDATERRASWWEDWTPWIAERGGEQRTPPAFGCAELPVLGDAPGEYVRGS
ncbi:alpha/beta hydrolase [Pseudonocardia sp. WMMC193]|uniref:PHA/PHB synthase family protein n=1 Tax=Pseudonocardia sp. WMMC193 TaxID=2911965 RepID=UPI001F489686|nr:alpha/beta fold hydrolase [Pseudonocardia sp. WMMC193]MCF7548714.1 alpha/beta fold hydrolase [Pseudonocardia sp. WMMC193]